VAAIDSLTAASGQWKIPWSDVNRFQRLTDDIVHPFDDAQPSIAVPFTNQLVGHTERTYDPGK